MNIRLRELCLIAISATSVVNCSAPPTQPSPDSAAVQDGSPPRTTVGRWSGSFTAQDGTSGGSARITVAQDATISGSLVDTVWQRAHTVARTGVISGSIAGGVAQLQVEWSTGQSEKFEGTATAPSFGSLGINLRQYAPDGNFARSGGVALALHEQGVIASPPYGQPATTQQDFLAQYAGRWTVNFYSADGNSGNGSLTITAGGDLTGALVDDGWSDRGPGGPMRHASLSGKIDGAGHLVLCITWSARGTVPSGSGEVLQGSGYFEEPETVVFQLGRDPESLKQNGPQLTMTMGRD